MTHHYNPEVSDTKMVDFANLRVHCLIQLRKEPLELFNDAENRQLVAAFARHTREYVLAQMETPEWKAFRKEYPEAAPPSWQDNAGFDIFIRDVEKTHISIELPKWAALACWLTPESVAGYAPSFMAEVAQLMLTPVLNPQA